MAESSDRVCPRCGHDADQHAFCPECGFDLKAQGELPTRAEWVRSRQELSAAAAPQPAGPAAPPGEPAAGTAPARGVESLSQSTVVPILVILVGLGLAVFGIVRIVSGDSEVGQLEDQRDSLQDQRDSLVADRTAIEKAGQETDAALGDFIEGAERVGERWEATVAANNRVVLVLNSGAEPTASALDEGRAANASLRKSVNQAERLLGEAREALSELEKTISAGEG